ncbi:hypothetical protein HK097_000161, partial [Rhizophlyctis rosea]
MYGPQLPPHLSSTTKPTSDNDSSPSEEEDIQIGPALPPHLAQSRKRKQREPERPPSQHSTSNSPKRRRPAGPSLPPPGAVAARTASPEDDSDDDTFGPAPPPLGAEVEQDDLQYRIAEIESRAQAAKTVAEAASQPEKVERGEWMLVPPEVQRLGVNLDNMKSRQFSKTGRPADIDQSGWTATPQDKAKKGGASNDKKKQQEPPRQPTTEELATQEFIRKHN